MWPVHKVNCVKTSWILDSIANKMSKKLSVFICRHDTLTSPVTNASGERDGRKCSKGSQAAFKPGALRSGLSQYPTQGATGAALEFSFSKLPLVEDRMRSTMGQNRLNLSHLSLISPLQAIFYAFDMNWILPASFKEFSVRKLLKS